MTIRENSGIGSSSRFDAAAAEETLSELDAQYAAGQIDRHAYFLKKRSLVSLFLKATTDPKPRRKHWETEL